MLLFILHGAAELEYVLSLYLYSIEKGVIRLTVDDECTCDLVKDTWDDIEIRGEGPGRYSSHSRYKILKSKDCVWSTPKYGVVDTKNLI